MKWKDIKEMVEYSGEIKDDTDIQELSLTKFPFPILEIDHKIIKEN
uniref:Uncharacterized protein n=1 Tax=viral metagenome TaxID=1070528 RepID=A0A6H2A5J2_9ZZZZ